MAAFYESAGFEVVINGSEPGQQVDIISTKYITGIGLTRARVECKYLTTGSLGVQAVKAFASSIQTLITSGTYQRGVLVCNRPFSKAAIDFADKNPFIELLAERDIDNSLLGVRESYVTFIRNYEADDIFQHYLEVTAEAGGQPELAFDLITSALDLPFKGLVWVLGDYGAGKTTLMDRIKYSYAKQYIERRSNLKPVYIALKDFATSHSLEGLLYRGLSAEFKADVALESFWQHAHRGELLLLLDGFDEMLSRSDLSSRQHLIREILPLMTTSSPTILSCRPTFFGSATEFREASRRMAADDRPLELTTSSGLYYEPPSAVEKMLDLADRLHERLHARRFTGRGADTRPIQLNLLPLSRSNVRDYLERRKSELESKGVEPQSVERFLYRVYDLKDLMTRPLLLKMIVDTLIVGGIDVSDETLQIGPAGLYEVYTNAKLKYDWQKGDARQFVPNEARRVFAQGVAMAMLGANSLNIDYESVSVAVEEAARGGSQMPLPHGASLEELSSDVLTCGFLKRMPTGDLTFTHKSFMEFFAAQFLKERLDPPTAHRSLDSALPNEILYFLGSYCLVDPLLNLRIKREAIRLQNDTSANIAYRRNIIGASFHSVTHHKGTKIINAKLFDLSFTQLLFTEAVFDDVNLLNVQIDCLSLTDCQVGCECSCVTLAKTDLVKSQVAIGGEGIEIGELTAKECLIEVETSKLDSENIRLVSTSLAISSPTRVGHLHASDSHVSWTSRKGVALVREIRANGTSLTADMIVQSDLVLCSRCHFVKFRLRLSEAGDMRLDSCTGLVLVSGIHARDDSLAYDSGVAYASDSMYQHDAVIQMLIDEFMVLGGRFETDPIVESVRFTKDNG